MTTKTKVEYNEQSKCIVTSVKIESDTLTPSEVVALTRDTFVEAFEQAKTLNYLKL